MRVRNVLYITFLIGGKWFELEIKEISDSRGFQIHYSSYNIVDIEDLADCQSIVCC